MRDLLLTRRFFLSVVLALACCTPAIPSPLPPDAVLQDKVIEVGRAMRLTEAYQDRAEGLFVWRVRLSVSEPTRSAGACNGLFAWYIKRIDDKVALDDPVRWSCRGDTKSRLAELNRESRRLQQEFKGRWLAAVGPVTLTPPTAQTHLRELLVTVLERLSQESGGRTPRATSPAPDGFAWRQLPEINAAVLIPDGWYFKRVTGGGAAVDYFVSVENIDARGSFDTGLSLHMLVPRSRSEDVEASAKAIIARIAGQYQVLKPPWELADGVFHHYGCLIRMQGTAGPLVVHHRAIVNTRTKTMYLLEFESPEIRWEEAWAKGAKVVELLLLDEKV